MNTPAPASRGRRLLALAIAAGFIVLVALLYYGVRQSDRADRESLPSPLIGRAAPEFSLPVLHDASYRVGSADLRGQPYLLNIWGSWCPACRDEHPVLAKYAETKRIRVVGYNWKDEPADALRWLEQFGNPYWVVIADYEGRTAIQWGIYGAPETFLVDAEGIIRWKHVGPLTDEIVDEVLAPMVDAMAKEG
ncbi:MULTISPECIES: DsbE family thiol:disulfide interchange protein [unclassified Luteimonas]|uniref:DsbE family thiol:disulfide interchange protein n=1 Tax=unclassified Luteimonas TaxID=2629088 RepID=UPI0018F0A2EF|nr:MULTISPECIES: DsbE family thiol:disulfide interchange protein [unclassified Luteimonas]MBJ6980732.1 DsbE family thiol:disulfide interchange protein [Luteimonas sp. MC1572]MBJ7574004.1 DsbE family thiol:disulfide interchange protein [Luteimonas sp. MC1828]QQO02102.1 DsbE family thiol:disulfide interchange protein [Luteimonas sp. MC1572]